MNVVGFLLLGLFLFAIFGLGVSRWVSDVRFYFRNAWDFSQDSGKRKIRPRFGIGTPYSNRFSVLIVQPVSLLVSFSFLIHWLLALLKGLNQ